MSSTIIEVAGLVKHFDGVTAVKGIDFTVQSGELFGFLGPNGAGKTTTINMLTGLTRPSKGTIRIAGIECSTRLKTAQHLIGVVPDESNLCPELTGYENLCFCGSLYGMTRYERRTRAQELLDRFNLAEAAKRKFAGYSKGMKRKLTIAAAIMHKPKILFLDEPTTGVDVVGARQIRQMVTDLQQAGSTIFLTTHYIEEAERLCDRIAFIVAGRIVRIDTVENLIQPIKEKHVMVLSISNLTADVHEKLCLAFPRADFCPVSNGQIRIESTEPIQVGSLVRLLEGAGSVMTEARKIQPSLEDVFLCVTGLEASAMKQEKQKAGASQ